MSDKQPTTSCYKWTVILRTFINFHALNKNLMDLNVMQFEIILVRKVLVTVLTVMLGLALEFHFNR